MHAIPCGHDQLSWTFLFWGDQCRSCGACTPVYLNSIYYSSITQTSMYFSCLVIVRLRQYFVLCHMNKWVCFKFILGCIMIWFGLPHAERKVSAFVMFFNGIWMWTRHGNSKFPFYWWTRLMKKLVFFFWAQSILECHLLFGGVCWNFYCLNCFTGLTDGC